MKTNSPKAQMTDVTGISRYLLIAALIVIVGTILSGPVGVLMVKAAHPQPPWKDAELFAQNFHVIQSVPYYFGIILMLGFLLFFSALPKAQTESARVMKQLCHYFAGLYAITIFINYFLQIAVIPNYLDQPAVLTAFAADNAMSLFWYIEMVGYGFLGLATWTCACLFSAKGLHRTLRFLMALNGISSIFSAVWNFVDPGWVFTPFGISSYVLWNLLIILIMVYVILIYRSQKPGLASGHR